jgi:hypothetical protein
VRVARPYLTASKAGSYRGPSFFSVHAKLFLHLQVRALGLVAPLLQPKQDIRSFTIDSLLSRAEIAPPCRNNT